LAQQSGVMPRSKAEAEQWFNQYIKPGMQAAGFQVDQVKGDSAFIHTRENPQGEWVDFVRGAGSNDRNYQALAWQSQGPGRGRGGGGPPPAAGGTGDPLQQLLAMIQALMDPSLSDQQKQQGLQQLLGALQNGIGGAGAAGAAGTSAPSAADKPFNQVP